MGCSPCFCREPKFRRDLKIAGDERAESIGNALERSEVVAIEDQDWARLTTDHSQCTGRHCPNFQQCVFYKAREGMGKVDVIVTNHDMVLADLALDGRTDRKIERFAVDRFL